MDTRGPSLCQGNHRFIAWLKQRSDPKLQGLHSAICPALPTFRQELLAIQEEEQMALMGSQFQELLNQVISYASGIITPQILKQEMG